MSASKDSGDVTGVFLAVEAEGLEVIAECKLNMMGALATSSTRLPMTNG